MTCYVSCLGEDLEFSLLWLGFVGFRVLGDLIGCYFAYILWFRAWFWGGRAPCCVLLWFVLLSGLCFVNSLGFGVVGCGTWCVSWINVGLCYIGYSRLLACSGVWAFVGF